MTRDVALAEAKKRTKGTRKGVKTPDGVEPIPLTEWLEHAEKKTEQIMGGDGSPALAAISLWAMAEQLEAIAKRISKKYP